jgi:hypothetical protein
MPLRSESISEYLVSLPRPSVKYADFVRRGPAVMAEVGGPLQPFAMGSEDGAHAELVIPDEVERSERRMLRE